MNNVVLIGRLTKTPELRQNGDSSVVRFTLAVDRRFKNKEGKYDADFIQCVAFKNTADFISKYFDKGMRIAVVGHLQTGSYTNKEGNKVNTCDVIIDSAEFVENKKNDNHVNNDGFVNTQTDSDGFANVSDDLELPFN